MKFIKFRLILFSSSYDSYLLPFGVRNLGYLTSGKNSELCEDFL